MSYKIADRKDYRYYGREISCPYWIEIKYNANKAGNPFESLSRVLILLKSRCFYLERAILDDLK